MTLTGIVCYLERSGPGGAISRVRLVGPELDRTWTAPSSESGSGSGAATGMNGAASLVSPVHSLRAAAAWVAEELGRVRELAAICVDPAGGVCGWLSTPSTSPEIVIAALQQAQNSNMIPGVAEAPAGSGFSLLGDGPLGPGSDRSIEALAPIDAKPASPLLARFSRNGQKSATVGKRRLAILSIPDAAARVFIDELDKLKIEVHSVMSLWHAAAASWDPGRPANSSRRGKSDENGADQPNSAEVVASSSPPTAVLLIEPSGRVVWTWSIGGDLVAAGSMRARVHPRGLPPVTTGASGAPLPAGPLPGDPQSVAPLDLEGAPPAARRIGESTIIEPPPLPVIQYGEPEIGRLVMDWLSWSAQLGISPERIICLGPETTPGRDASLAATLSESLARAWPGATADVAVYDDPVGATLNRLRGLDNLGITQFRPGHLAPSQAVTTADPRAGLVSLSRRPGRATRSIYRWGTLATLVASACIFFLARRLESTTHDAAEQLDEIKAARTELLKTVETVDPLLKGISTRTGAYDEMQHKLRIARDERTKLTRERPILPELLRLLRNMDGLDVDVQIQQIEIGTARAYMTVTLPYTQVDRYKIPDFYKKLQSDPELEMHWRSGDFEGDLIPSPDKNGVPMPSRRKHWFEGLWLDKSAPIAPGPAPSGVIAPGGKS